MAVDKDGPRRKIVPMRDDESEIHHCFMAFVLRNSEFQRWGRIIDRVGIQRPAGIRSAIGMQQGGDILFC